MRTTLSLLPGLAKRLHPHTRGRWAEKIALAAYLVRGYRRVPPARRALAQADLTLTRGATVLVVEVKYRPTRSRGHVALTPAQKARLVRQLRALAAAYPAATLRLEILLVFPHWPFLQRIPQLDLA